MWFCSLTQAELRTFGHFIRCSGSCLACSFLLSFSIMSPLILWTLDAPSLAHSQIYGNISFHNLKTKLNNQIQFFVNNWLSKVKAYKKLTKNLPHRLSFENPLKKIVVHFFVLKILWKKIEVIFLFEKVGRLGVSQKICTLVRSTMYICSVLFDLKLQSPMHCATLLGPLCLYVVCLSVCLYVCFCPLWFWRFGDSNYSNCKKIMSKYKNNSKEGS